MIRIRIHISHIQLYILMDFCMKVKSEFAFIFASLCKMRK